MSDTQRKVQDGWGPGNPVFDRMYPQIITVKHQTKDRKPRPKGHSFRSALRNSLHNLRRKNDQLSLRENLETI